jgi:hypothetical protein
VEEDPASPDGEQPPRPDDHLDPPESVVFRRRRGDWLSDREPFVGSEYGEPRWHARRAAMELAKATVIAHDGLTGDHSDDVSLLCEALAEQLGVEDSERSNLMAAAQLHDIGKIAVPESVLQKPGPLIPEEWDVVRRHTVVGSRILGAVPELREISEIVRHSHEHWDGSGYPDRLAGDAIPLASRVLLCADAFHAIRTNRPYRRGRSARDALEEIRAHAGTEFDPAVVAALERVIATARAGTGGRFSARAADPVASRRLAALLLALTLAGGALAALNKELSDDKATASDGPRLCAPGGCPPLAPVASFELTPRAGPQDKAAVRPSPKRHARRPARRSRGRRSSVAPPPPQHAGRRPVPAPLPAPPPAAPSTQSTSPPPKLKPPSGHRGQGHAYAYGHEKRLANPHPPKPPPGRMKPKRAP